MSRLYLVPVLHTGQDMGSLAGALEARAGSLLGPGVWRQHQETLAGFWSAIARFFDGLEVRGFKIYQDGLVEGGVEGSRIVREAAARGSVNYQLVSRLLERGAVLVATEGLSLVKQEHDYITTVLGAKSVRERAEAALRYRVARRSLLARRDEFIAGQVRATLGDGETGILFIGAEHDVLSRLPADIAVVEVKDVKKVREYHLALTIGRLRPRLEELTRYLTAPVSV